MGIVKLSGSTCAESFLLCSASRWLRSFSQWSAKESSAEANSTENKASESQTHFETGAEGRKTSVKPGPLTLSLPKRPLLVVVKVRVAADSGSGSEGVSQEAIFAIEGVTVAVFCWKCSRLSKSTRYFRLKKHRWREAAHEI